MVYVSASGIRTFLLKAGKGKIAFTLIHGAAWNHKLWSEQISAISTLGEVIAIDLPGHGASDQFADMRTTSIKSYADHVHSVLSTLNKPNVILVGHSMGGATSMKFTLDHPSNVKAIILIGTGAKLGVNPAILSGLSEQYEQTIEASKDWAFATKTDRRTVEAGIAEMLKCRPEVAVADFTACNKFDIRDSVSRIQVPTLILVGNEDKLTPLKWSEYLHGSIKGSELGVIEGAGHMVTLEKPHEVNKRIASFVEKTELA